MTKKLHTLLKTLCCGRRLIVDDDQRDASLALALDIALLQCIGGDELDENECALVRLAIRRRHRFVSIADIADQIVGEQFVPLAHAIERKTTWRRYL